MALAIPTKVVQLEIL